MTAMCWWSAPAAPGFRPRSPPPSGLKVVSSRRSRASAAPPRAPAAGSGFPARRWRRPGASSRTRSRRAPICATRPATVLTPRGSMPFSTTGPEAVDFFTTKTAVRFDMPLTFPDYHAEAPGGAQGGRSMVTRPFDGRELGDAYQGYRQSPARADRVRHDARLRQGDRAFHARDEIAGVGGLCGQAAVANMPLDVMRTAAA